LRCESWAGGTCAMDCSISRSCLNENLTCISSCPGNSGPLNSLPACLTQGNVVQCQ
jgi:hypothetical protein